MKSNHIVLFVSLMFSSVACVASPSESLSDESDGKITTTSEALGVSSEVVGDTACASGYSLATPAEAQANQSAICSQLGTWDIARLAGGGSMAGSGYGRGRRGDPTQVDP